MVLACVIRCNSFDLGKFLHALRRHIVSLPLTLPFPSLSKKMATKGMEHRFEGLSILESENKLVIGVDFGTTYSGVAYLFTGVEKPEPLVITEWPGAKGADKQKVPTLIRYEVSQNRRYQWGYELAHSLAADKIEGIKLLLDPDHPKPLYVPQTNTKAELRRLGKPAIDVAADYIAALYKHALSKIEQAWPADYLQMLEKQFVLSVPAVWSDKAKDSTLKVRLFGYLIHRPS